MRSRLLLLIGTVTLTGVMAAPALAGQGTGAGQTANSAALGFVAMSNLNGQLNYVADPLGPDAGFIGHCDGYTSFVYSETPAGDPKVTVTATCTDVLGNVVYLKAGFIDRGEPGRNDSACLLWSDNPSPTPQNSFVVDRGHLQAGNIQIKKDPISGESSAEMLVP